MTKKTDSKPLPRKPASRPIPLSGGGTPRPKPPQN